MAGITLAQAEEQLAIWMAASSAVAKKQEYQIGDRSLTHVDAAEIREQITFWDGHVQRLGGTSRPVIGFGVPRG